MVKVSRDLVRDDFLRDQHGFILRFPVALIQRVLFIDLDQPALFIVNLLPEPNSRVIGAHLLEIACEPTRSSRNVQPVTPSAVRQLIPIAEFLLVLRPRTHFCMTVPSSSLRHLGALFYAIYVRTFASAAATRASASR